MDSIRRADLQMIIDAIPAKQKAMRRNVFAYASVLFGWAQRRGYIEQNPILGMEKPGAPAPRDRVLTDQELALVWRASFDLRIPFGSFYRLLILTGQRREEVAAMSWSEIDQERREWVIPASRSKNRLAHIVPLSDQVMSELAGVLEAGGVWPKSGFVLTTNNKRPISGFSKAKLMLDEQVDAVNDGQSIAPWRAHDLRRTFATGMQRLGVRFEVTEAILNHVSGARGGIAGVYQRHDWKDEKRAALQAWAGNVCALSASPTAMLSARCDADQP